MILYEYAKPIIRYSANKVKIMIIENDKKLFAGLIKNIPLVYGLISIKNIELKENNTIYIYI